MPGSQKTAAGAATATAELGSSHGPRLCVLRRLVSYRSRIESKSCVNPFPTMETSAEDRNKAFLCSGVADELRMMELSVCSHNHTACSRDTERNRAQAQPQHQHIPRLLGQNRRRSGTQLKCCQIRPGTVNESQDDLVEATFQMPSSSHGMEAPG